LPAFVGLWLGASQRREYGQDLADLDRALLAVRPGSPKLARDRNRTGLRDHFYHFKHV
jgi:hypothetical protein